MFSFRHVGITVQDMEKSLKLYKDYFRFQVVWDEIEKGKFIDDLSGIDNIVVRTVKLKDFVGGMIELLEYESHPKPLESLRPIVNIGVSHFAMTVDNLDKTHDDLVVKTMENLTSYVRVSSKPRLRKVKIVMKLLMNLLYCASHNLIRKKIMRY